jgi:hypothetical protein
MLFVGYAEVKANGVPSVPIFANLQKIEHWRDVRRDGDSGGSLDQEMTHTQMLQKCFPFCKLSRAGV